MTKKEDVRQFGLIGRNIDYSFSRRYFAEKFEREQLPNCRYDNFDLKEIDQVTAVLNGAQKIAGLNVTIPYKKAIIPFLDHISPEAKQINAVNTICRRKEGWVGYNTDCYGFERSLEAILPQWPEKALILGTGGAAAAVKFVLDQHQVAHTSVSRSPSEGEIHYDDINAEVLDTTFLIINTTPLGTFPNTDVAPSLPYGLLRPKHLLFDLIYNPAETLFLKKGKENGAQTLNGSQMLVFQAEKAWELWNL